MSSSLQKQVLVKGLGVALSECLFALNGPFLFQRFGFNVPAAALTGCLVGAGIGYAAAAALLHSWNRRHGVSSVPELTRPEVTTGLKDLDLAGLSGNVDSDRTRERVERALAPFVSRDCGDIRVEVRCRKVILKGKVHTWVDEAEAERIAFDVPGIQEVDNRLQVVP